MSFAKLYELSLEGVQISDLLTENEGELTPEIESRLDKLMLEGPERIEAAAMVVKQLEASATACEDEVTRLRERAKAFSDNADRLKKRMVIAVDSAFNGKVKTPLFSVWAQSTAATTVCDLAPGIDAEQFYQSHPELVRVKYELNRTAAVAKYKAGESMPEELFFTTNEPTRYLRIK